ncbi:hypothetical protein [Luteolibacter marinus]|uniref:hypothetical protein n=1 Tax=Luteolibacter marinus TaxID=2776705 RepID=UPI001866C593|nr:hypothetical protein [Luteolibacter marinus]
MKRKHGLAGVAVAGIAASILIGLLIWPEAPSVDEPVDPPVVSLPREGPRKELPKKSSPRQEAPEISPKIPARPEPEVLEAKELAGSQEEAVDPDEEFMKKISGLPLDRAEYETRLEVEGRIKDSEKIRAKLIYSKSSDGKNIFAYAVSQPSMEEVRKMTRPYQLLLEKQDSPSGRAYVDKQIESLFNTFRLTDGRYRLLYSIVPEVADGGFVQQYSIAASSEAECLEILHDDLAPRPPIVMGVTYRDSNYERIGGRSYGVTPGHWRMDHLVSGDLLAPFNRSSYRFTGNNTGQSSAE